MPHRSLPRRWGVLAGAATVAIMVAFLLAAVTAKTRRHELKTNLTTQRHTDRVICERVNRVYTVIREQIRLSQVAIPKLTYYQRHPAELARVQAATARELKAFTPKPCPKDGG